MGLDDFTSGSSSGGTTAQDDEEPSGNKRQYTRFDRDDFESCLVDTEYDFEEVNYDWTKELVYETKSSNGRFTMRIYSSLDKRTGEARDKGSDAIRLVVLHSETERPVLKEKRTNRIKTWCKNLKQKINNIAERKASLNFCDKCGHLMVIRKNKKKGNKFWGCSNYPDCKNTESI